MESYNFGLLFGETKKVWLQILCPSHATFSPLIKKKLNDLSLLSITAIPNLKKIVIIFKSTKRGVM